MFRIQNITSYPYQGKSLVLPDGTRVEIDIQFFPLRKCWVIKRLSYQDFLLHSYKIVNGTNILRQFKNILPFGLACYDPSGRDPQFLEDFTEQGSHRLFILTQDEVQRYEDRLSGIS